MPKPVLSAEERAASAQWVRHFPNPPDKSAGIGWHVFISYRSLNRKWALALYDTLREAGYDLFLDQYELAAGAEIEETLTANLQKSASAVLVWTNAASESRWVAAELKKMQAIKAKRPSFQYVIAKLDDADLPFLEQGTLYVDFTKYPDGPRGGELLRLMYGLAGKPLSPEAVDAVQELDEETTRTLNEIAAARGQGDVESLLRLGLEVTPVLVATPLPISNAADALIALKAFGPAIEVLEVARRRFSSAIRPLQLLGLAYRRQGEFEKAANDYFAKLYAAGHRDPETLGMYAATWWGRYEQTRDKRHGERAQALYAEAFRLVPSDSYVGVNAASKAVLLGRLEEGRDIAMQVLPLVEKDSDGTDFWKTVTHAEVRLLAGDVKRAAELYDAAVVRHSGELSSIDTARAQVGALAGALGVAKTDRELLMKALEPSRT